MDDGSWVRGYRKTKKFRVIEGRYLTTESSTPVHTVTIKMKILLSE